MTPDEARGIYMRNEAHIRAAERARLKAITQRAEAEATLKELKVVRQRLTLDLRPHLTMDEMAKRSRLTRGTIQGMCKLEMTRRGLAWWEIKASR